MDGVRSVALTLPLEMQHEIALQCDRSALACLARVHSAWTPACEAVLYANVSIAISWQFEWTVDLLGTLAIDPHKAERVRSFSVTFPLDIINREVDEGRDTGLPWLLLVYCNVLSRMSNLATLRVPSVIDPSHSSRFYEGVLQVIQTGKLKLKSLVVPDELVERLLSTLDKALAPYTDTFRCLGLSFYYYSPAVAGTRWHRLAHFATRYSVFTTSESSSDIHLYPVSDASSSMWNSELYVQDIQRATYTRGDLKGPHVTVTFLQQCYPVVPRLLRYLATSFPVIKAFTFTLLHRETLDYYADYPSSSDVFPAWEAIIGAFASFECQVTTLAFTCRCESPGMFGGVDIELTREEESMLLRLIGNRCSSVQEVTLPDDTKYHRDPNAEEGWYITDADPDWERDNRFHYGSDDTDSDPYEGYEFYGSD